MLPIFTGAWLDVIRRICLDFCFLYWDKRSSIASKSSSLRRPTLRRRRTLSSCVIGLNKTKYRSSPESGKSGGILVRCSFTGDVHVVRGDKILGL